jgi:hypothetical protein
MAAERPGFPFRIVLPLVQLLVCLVLLWPRLPALSSQLRMAARELSAKVFGTEPPPENSQIVLDVTPVVPRREQALDLDALRLTAPAALNIPVGFVQIPFMLDNPSRSEWAPTGMWIREWRAVSWPFVGLIFWWMAGRGLEAIGAGARFFAVSQIEEAERQHRRAPKLHGIELLIGAALVVVGGVSCYVLASGSGVLGLATDYVMAAGAGLWAVLGLLIVIGGLVQWRVRTRERQASVASAEAG